MKRLVLLMRVHPKRSDFRVKCASGLGSMTRICGPLPKPPPDFAPHTGRAPTSPPPRVKPAQQSWEGGLLGSRIRTPPPPPVEECNAAFCVLLNLLFTLSSHFLIHH